MNFLPQTTSHVLMIRPANFGFNTETAQSNSFQTNVDYSSKETAIKARQEFDVAVAKLKAFGINVNVFEDTDFPVKPDAAFPNNWISFSHDGTAFIYPMYASNRQAEIRLDIVEALRTRYHIKKITDLRETAETLCLEGTGSIVFDHANRIAFSSVSERTNTQLLDKFCAIEGYNSFIFHSYDKKQNPIYHTNVMMSVASDFAVICLDALSESSDKVKLENKIRESGREIIPITIEQMGSYAGNMLALRNEKNEELMVMSETAEKSLSPFQKATINQYAEIVSLNIPTIETVGGGSARCMIAEIFCSPLQ